MALYTMKRRRTRDMTGAQRNSYKTVFLDLSDQLTSILLFR